MQRIHGLTIASATPLPGLSQLAFDDAQRADVRLVVCTEPLYAVPPSATVRYRSVGAGTSADATLTVSQLADGRTAFRYSDGTAFDVVERDGAIDIAAVIGAGQELEDLSVYLYGPVLGFVLRRLGRLALHASCVSVDGRAAAFVGASGAGKSTTAAALALGGASLLADDLVALERTGDSWRAHPAFDHVRVWTSSEPLLYGRTGVLERITPGWEKLRVPLRAQLAPAPAPLAAIYLLQWDEPASAPAIAPVHGAEALLSLAGHSYSNYLLSPRQKATELEQLGHLVARVPVRRLARSRTAGSMDAIRDAIERDMRATPPAAP